MESHISFIAWREIDGQIYIFRTDGSHAMEEYMEWCLKLLTIGGAP